MLKELYIENLAVIKQANIQFDNNLNIFTGETGAGKSILINGINAVLGQRVTKDIVRSGCDKATISAVFSPLNESCKVKLSENGFDFEDDSIIITREISSDGGSIARVNSKPVNVSILREIGETLVNIHGQHDNQILLKSERHIDIIDSFGDISNLLSDYQNKFKNLQEIARNINKLKISEKEKALRLEELNEIIEDIEELDITENEDVVIEDEFSVLNNSTKIIECIQRAKVFLSGDDSFEGAIVLADNSAEEVSKITNFQPESEALNKRIKATSIELDDIATELGLISSSIDISPERYDFISKRRTALNKIKRKYGPNLSDVLESYNKAIAESQQLEQSEDKIAELEKIKENLLNDVSEKAKLISKERKKLCEKFVKEVCEQLTFLDMPNVKLAVDHSVGKLTINGMDNIELLISANIGEPPKPISKIASGGELSRIMLALKNVLAEKDDIPTLIFDEIDTGVSGRAAQKIGIKLAQISKFRQVLCVTHLAQIAVMADTHLCIEKNVVKNATITKVEKLDTQNRKLEIARIMGGENITELMLANAQELIDNSKSLVN